ncbi:GNAT family N-acetyltransferase [Elioraea rosea]|uniref:GNAT family N-acetyltransferase n=1 Tax=Elioraea rosea TaxID=2492390 RepID=UPI00131551A8|nr:GNAT family N-acetyltransferase [Elioraea rosea]
MTIRRAGPGDATALLALAAALARTQNDPDDRATIEDLREAWLDQAAPGLALIAEREGEAIGYLAMMPSFESSHGSHGFYVSDLFVTAAHRRRGTASALLAAAAREALARGRTSLWWVAMPDNEDAHMFYRRHANIEQRTLAFAVLGERLAEIARR